MSKKAFDKIAEAMDVSRDGIIAQMHEELEKLRKENVALRAECNSHKRARYAAGERILARLYNGDL